MSGDSTPDTAPRTMTAIEISEPGGPEVLRPATLPVPHPGAGDLLVKVAAAGVNRPDILQRLGGYPPPPGAPDTPGLEIAGTVVAMGAKAPETAQDAGQDRGQDTVQDWRIGDTLCALVAGGGYAEYCLVPAPQALPVPAGLDMIAAAALPETFFTVWTNLFERGGLRPGESVLIHGGSSGIGTTAIQLAAAFGATVYATAGSAAKCQACETLGAARAINYRTEDFTEVLHQVTRNRGVDVILDMVGGDYVARNLSVLATDGRLVNIAFLQGAKVEVNLLPIMLKRLTLTGSTLRPRPVAEKGAIARALHEKVWPLLAEGRIRPVIDSTFPLAEAGKAHARMESSKHIGKIVLTV